MAEKVLSGYLDTNCKFYVYYDDVKKVVTGYKIENNTKQRCVVSFDSSYKETTEVRPQITTIKTIDSKVQPELILSKDNEMEGVSFSISLGD